MKAKRNSISKTDKTIKPLVSVTIPTLNSEAVIEGCLASVKAQSYPNIETIVVDSLSGDRTIEIVTSYGARAISYEGRLLGARHQGVVHSRGNYILLLDSDQILEATCVERAVSMMDKYGMLVLEELSYRPKSWLEKLFQADRQLIHKHTDSSSLDPVKGTLLPRFFKRHILVRAFEAMPQELIPMVVHHDHAIICFEAFKITQKVGILAQAVYHREASSISKAWRTNFRYGRSLREFSRLDHYRELVNGRDKGFRKGAFTDLRLGLKSTLLLTFLKIAQKAGYFLGDRLA